jgi:hypothetical protein
MPHLDARVISRIACNPRCHRQAGLHLLGLSEQEAYALLTGRPYPGPRGERTAALVWGRLFEAKLAEYQAGRLLASLDGVLRIQPATARVRDLRQEVPDSQPEAVLERCRRTRSILADLLAGRRVPDLLLQPALQLCWNGVDWVTSSPMPSCSIEHINDSFLSRPRASSAWTASSPRGSG